MKTIKTSQFGNSEIGQQTQSPPPPNPTGSSSNYIRLILEKIDNERENVGLSLNQLERGGDKQKFLSSVQGAISQLQRQVQQLKSSIALFVAE